jgi:predicted NBD/HSP70 family sugar kinase
MNDQAALGYMLEAGPVSRSGLEELTGLSKPATAELLQRLEAAGLVEKAGKRDGGPGPKAQLWSVKADAGFAAAAHCSSDGVEVLVSDLRGRHRGRCSQPLSTEALPVQVRKCLDAACDEAGISTDKVLHFVVGVPEALDPRTGVLKYTPHLLSGWEGQNMVSVLQQATGVSTQIENDVNLMALAELENDLIGDKNNFVLIWFDKGLGSAIVLDRELFRGTSGGAGEIEYILVPDPAAAVNGTTRPGAKLSQLLSPAAIQELARDHGLDGNDPVEAIRTACEQGSAGQAFFSDLAARTACGLTAVVTLLDPELVLLGGRFSAAGGPGFALLVQEKLADLLSTPRVEAVPVISYPISAGAVIAGAIQSAVSQARTKAFATGSVIAL